jgi:hypothetical protein
MILAENLEAPLQPRSLPLCSLRSFVRGACPACPEPLGDSVGVLNSFSPLPATPTRQTVSKLVTPGPPNVIFCPLCFQSLAHSFAGSLLATPLQSYRSALFAQNTGGWVYPSGFASCFQAFTHSSRPDLLGLPRSGRGPLGVHLASQKIQREAASVAVPSIRRWSLVVFPWEFRSISFPFLSLPDSFLSNDGGVHPPFFKETSMPLFSSLSALRKPQEPEIRPGQREFLPLHQSRITSHQPPITSHEPPVTKLGVYCLFSLRTKQ